MCDQKPYRPGARITGKYGLGPGDIGEKVLFEAIVEFR
jgi:hypothetical protein